MEYDIEILIGDRVVRGVEGDFANDDDAIKTTYFYIGFYNCDAARLYRGGHTNPRDEATLVIEITSPLTAADRRMFGSR